jgi:hypothetical protein
VPFLPAHQPGCQPYAEIQGLRRSRTINGMTFGSKMRWGFTIYCLFLGLSWLVEGAYAEGVPMTVLGLLAFCWPWLWRHLTPRD